MAGAWHHNKFSDDYLITMQCLALFFSCNYYLEAFDKNIVSQYLPKKLKMLYIISYSLQIQEMKLREFK